MPVETDTDERIGPKLSLADVSLPPAVGERFATLYGGAPPDTAADWVAAMRTAVERERDRAPTVEDLCTTPDGDHEFAGAATTQSYICVLDPLVYPFLTGEPGTVRSETPVRGETVTFDVGAEGFDVSHDEAVVSVGVSDHVDAVDEVTLDTVYRQVCGYIQTFEDEQEYEAWAVDVAAATTPLSAAEGVAVARELAAALFDGGQSQS